MTSVLSKTPLRLKHMNDKEKILHQMIVVQEKHTWLNNIEGLVKPL